jgi:hypothetical protein
VPNLLGKLIAGGLSAAVILVWWPAFFPSDSIDSWLARGVVWTLAFELVTHALSPLEDALWETAGGLRLRRWARACAPRRLGGTALLACSVAAVAAVLLSVAPDRPRERVASAQAVKHVTKVERVVRVERSRPRATRVMTSTVPAPPDRQAAGTSRTLPAASREKPAIRRATPTDTRRSTPTASPATDDVRPEPPLEPAPVTTSAPPAQQGPASTSVVPRVRAEHPATT